MTSPLWLTERRAAVAARLGEPVLPSTDEEVWRYSRVGELDLSAWHAATPAEGVPSAVSELLGSLGHLAAAVVVRNGSIVASRIDDALAARGVHVGSLVDGPEAETALGCVAGAGPDVFTALNDLESTAPVLVHVPAGVEVDAPIVVVDWIDDDRVSVHPRLVVRIGVDASARVLEWHGSDDVAAFAAPVTELDLAPAARLGYTSVQMRGRRVWQLASVLARVERDATLSAGQVGLGGDYARVRTDCRLVGRGATGDLSAVYFGTGDQTLDFRTFQHHDAPDTTSNLLFKGAVDDRSRSVYTGLIRVEPSARGTSAFQTNRNLKLSDEAWAESVPNLEIETNDVRCSHASTVSPVDPDQSFYLESRGVPTELAERLVVLGFFDEVVDTLSVHEVRGLVSAAIAERLTTGAH